MVKKYSDVIRNTLIWYAIVPIIVLSLGTYIILFFCGNKLLERENFNTNKHISGLVEDNIKEYTTLITSLSINQDVINVMNNSNDKQKIYEILYKFVNKRDLKANFFVFDKNGKMVMSNKNLKPNYIKEENIFMWGLFERMKLKPTEAITMINRSSLEGVGYGILTVGKAIVEDDEIIGYITFDLSEVDIFNLITGFMTSDVIITDKHNIVAATNNKYSDKLYKLKNDFRQKEGNIEVDNNTYYVEITRIQNTNLYVYTVTGTNFLHKAFFVGGIFLLILYLIIFVAMYLWSKKVAYSKTTAINEIVDAIKSIQEGNLNTKLDINSKDELELIASAYNDMLLDIENLIESNKQEVATRMKSEIKQLEAQFNPHFLFNTLEVIRVMIKLDKNVASDIIINLSSLLRYGINNEIHSVRLKEDIEYINNYLEILKYRFGDKLKFNININEEALNAIVPKLMIQSIIENAIKYGLESKISLFIDITAYFKNGKLYISIEDNGLGISNEKLDYLKKLLNSEENNTENIGLYNIHRRIKLIYGKEYGLNIDSIAGEGTRVEIVLPDNR